jgi:hypothetical protein
MSPFDDNTIIDRLFDKLDNIDNKIDDLCNRMTKQETKYDIHIDGEKSKAERKEKRFYVIMAIFAGIVSVIELVRGNIIG